MPTFIKTGYWESAVKSYKGWLNLEELIISSGAITGSGTAGRLAFWTSPSVQSATTNLFWDNVNNRLAIGSAPLTADFEINKNSTVIQAYRNINSGVNLTTGANVYQLDILGQRNGGTSTFARMNVFYNGDGITRRGKLLWGVAEASGFGGSNFMLSQTSSSVKIVGLGFNVSSYLDNDTTITTTYAQHAQVIVNGTTTLPLMSWDINGVVQNVMMTSGNLLLGSTLDGGQKLQVIGDVFIKGSGATAVTSALLMQNSSSVTVFNVRNDGRISNGDGTFYVDRYPVGGTVMTISTVGHNGATGMSVTSATAIRAYSNLGINSSNPLGASIYAAGGTSSGNISLGLLSNRALITATADGLNMHASSMLQVDSTTQGFLPPRMTTAQRTGISLPAAGLVVYDITDNRHYGYNGTTWNAFY